MAPVKWQMLILDMSVGAWKNQPLCRQGASPVQYPAG